jgi:hypothetical protein
MKIVVLMSTALVNLFLGMILFREGYNIDTIVYYLVITGGLHERFWSWCFGIGYPEWNSRAPKKVVVREVCVEKQRRRVLQRRPSDTFRKYWDA